MTRTPLIAVAAALALVACQPQNTPEQVAQEQAAAALQQLGMAAGSLAQGAGQLTPEQLAGLAQAGAIASAADPNLTPEERAKLQAITGAMASGQVHPAAASFLTGANKAFALLGGVKDKAGVEAVKPQVMAVYAEMAGPAATLKAMSEDQRDVAFGSAMKDLMSMSLNAAGVLSRVSYDPETMQAVGELIDQMPQPN